MRLKTLEKLQLLSLKLHSASKNLKIALLCDTALISDDIILLLLIYWTGKNDKSIIVRTSVCNSAVC